MDQSSPAFLAARGITGLPDDATFSTFPSDTRTYELAGFGDLTYHFTSKLSVTGGVRYGRYGGTVDTYPGFNSQYFVYALFGIPGPLAIAPTPMTTTHYPSAEKTSWKASVTYEPTRNLTEYVTRLYRLPDAGLQLTGRQRQHCQPEGSRHSRRRGLGQSHQL